MVNPASGPFIFDTSAESWLGRNGTPEVTQWLQTYLGLHRMSVSAVTVIERIRGYSLLWRRAAVESQDRIEIARIAYLDQLGVVLPVDSAVAVVAGEIMSLIPEPPTPPRRTHRMAESREDRLSRWRFDSTIAATALVAAMPLIHNNAADFEAIRSAIETSPQRFPKLGPLQLIRCTLLG